MGTSYGCGDIPNDFIDSNSIIYSFGAGEDIHWEVDIAKEFNCKVYVFDPTPRAIDHFHEFCTKVNNNEEYTSCLDLPYNANKKVVENLNFRDVALWNEDKIIKFFEPSNSKDVSYSINNIQSSNDYIEVQALCLSSIMKLNKHTHIDYIKIDIEGAEYDIINDLINKNNNIKVIYLECHYSKSLSPLQNVKRVYRFINEIIFHGFEIIHVRENRYFTLMRANNFS
tara:strand:+ start:370 stop:1047 length:678 start_codon:yes stop_codon:yes gene_type:complete